MSFPTKPCFVATPMGRSAETLKHPAMAFMRGFTTEWCETKAAQSEPYTAWLTPDFELGTSDGKRLRGEAGVKAFIDATRHYASSTVDVDVCYMEETADGYAGLALGKLYINLVVPGAKTCTDCMGREWELCVSALG